MSELHDLHDLFAASIGSAAALIGLLFVSISVAPDRIFGPEAQAERRSDAERAFTALGNVFFVSLVALLPHSARGAIVVIAVLAMAQTARVGIGAFRLDHNWRRLGLISFGCYTFELIAAFRLSSNDASADALVYIILGLYSYALGVSWGLLGSKAGR